MIKLKEIIKEAYEDPDDVAQELVDYVLELQNNIKRIKFDKIREWGKKYHRSAPALLKMLQNVAMWMRKIK